MICQCCTKEKVLSEYHVVITQGDTTTTYDDVCVECWNIIILLSNTFPLEVLSTHKKP